MAEKFTEREKQLLAGEEPDDQAPVQDERLDPVLNEAESAIRDEPVGRPSDDEIEYADDAPPVDPVQMIDEAEVPAERPSWVTDDVLDIAGSYSVTPEDLSVLQNRGEFDRAIRLLDAQAKQFYQQQPTNQPEPPAAEQAAPKEPAAHEEPTDGVLDLEAIRKEYEEKFDDVTVEALMKQATEIQKQQLKMQEWTRREEAVRISEIRNQFHDACDEVDPGFLGVSVNSSGQPVELPKHFADRRMKIAEAIETFVKPEIARQQAYRGVTNPNFPPFPDMVRIAKQYLHSKDPTVPGTPARAEALKRQSASRRPVGSGSQGVRARSEKSEPMTAEDQVDELLSSPVLNEVWSRYSNM